MTVAYRTVLHIGDGEDAVRVAKEQFRSWLMEMVRDPRKNLGTADWDGPGEFQLGPDSLLSVVEHVSDDESMSRLLLEYVETNEHGHWTTRLYATSAPNARKLKQVLWFESEGERTDGSFVQPGTPRVVRNTLQVVDAYDGTVPILSSPRIVRLEDVNELVEYIEDEARDISIVVAASVPGVATAKWVSAVESLTRDAVGCASFFVLEPEAEAVLNGRLGSAHAIPSGAVRTFVSGVELGDWADARRHRILTARTMIQGLNSRHRFSERLIRTIATTPRLNLLEADLPVELTRTARVLQREQIKPAEIVVDLPADVEELEVGNIPSRDEFAPSWLEKLKGIVHRIIGRDVVDDAALQAVAEKFEQQDIVAQTAAKNAQKLQAERERLEDQVADLRRQLEAEQFERALAELNRRDAEAKTRSLERWRSERIDKYTYVEETKAPWESDPGSVSEIVERLIDPENFGEILKYVELTDPGNAIDRADELDAIDPNGTYASAFWEYILVLKDYMEERVERGFNGNVHMYLSSPDVRGRKCPAQRHKANESETVQSNPKMRRERTFPVPKLVDPSGETFMTTHFAPTHRDQNAPRMYYYVDFNKTKKVYIGYIGVHLTNTKTN